MKLGLVTSLFSIPKQQHKGRSLSVDKQGLGRLSRGKHFYKFTEELLQKINMPFNWSIFVVPDSGHNHRKMGDAAVRFLYDDQNTIE